MVNHFDYLKKTGMMASEWEEAANNVAQKLVGVLRETGCTYYDAKAALSKAESILEQAMLKAKRSEEHTSELQSPWN